MSSTNTASAEGRVPDSGPLTDATAYRDSIFALTQQAEDAVLRPVDCGLWPTDLRAALAARLAARMGLASVAERYLTRVTGSNAVIADSTQDGADLGLAAVVAFMDKVAMEAHAVTAADIAGLQGAGISDADIVRLCELNAFLAYQFRLIAGLRLLSGATT